MWPEVLQVVPDCLNNFQLGCGKCELGKILIYHSIQRLVRCVFNAIGSALIGVTIIIRRRGLIHLFDGFICRNTSNLLCSCSYLVWHLSTWVLYPRYSSFLNLKEKSTLGSEGARSWFSLSLRRHGERFKQSPQGRASRHPCTPE